MAFNPTKEQKSAIDGAVPMLVCAAAGSGKTAVLAKRAARLLSDSVNPISADRLLIVTFTNSAAAEMRDRIEAYVEEICEKNPDNRFLLKQKLLLETAKICTIDSFCIDFVRENSELAGVDSDFRMLDQFELEDIVNKAITEVFNHHYIAETPSFFELMDAFGADYGDSNLSDAVKYIYNFTRNIPFPKNWLNECIKKSNAANKINDIFYSDFIYKRVWNIADLQSRKISKATDTLCDAGIDSLYQNILFYIKAFLDNVKQLCEKKDWDSLFKHLTSYSPDKLPTVKDPYLKQYADAVKTLKSDIKGAVDDCCRLVYSSEQDALNDHRIAGGLIKHLINLTLEVEDRIADIMREKNAYTFYNTEQFTLELLCKKGSCGLEVSELAKDMINRFDEIMVDEYQDVNDLQDTIFQILSDNGKKLFAVGDDKQSIYGFRGSNPENFTRKMESGEIERIDMSGNFRSRSKVCEFINRIFSDIYPDYNESVCLEPLGVFPENEQVGCEILVCEGEKSAVENEAEGIAKYINSIVEKEPFLRDGENLRKAEYEDIAVLMPTVKGKVATYLKVFKQHGIPVSSGGSDFASSAEVLLAMSLLRLADNPSYDAAALSVMMSHIGGFSADDVARIRLLDKRKSIYASVLKGADEGDAKCISFVSLVNRLRSESISLTLSQFINKAFRISGIYELICAYGEGELRRSNLGVIIDMAASFEKSSGSSFSHFLAYMDRALKTGFESPVSSAGKGSVKLMSIHASKGLQFPICIIAGMSEKFNYSSGKNSVAANELMGISLRFTDEEKRERYTSPAKLIMADLAVEKLYEEKKRLLYVALTRAEELLVLSVNKNYSNKALATDAGRALLLKGDKCAFEEVVGSFSAMVMPVILFCPDATSLREQSGVSIDISCEPEGLMSVVSSDDIFTVEKEDKEAYASKPDKDLVCKLKQIFGYEYPFAELNSLEIKTSVSAVVRENTGYSDFSARPAFMSKFGLTPAQRGTIMHKFMECADLTAAQLDLDSEIERLVEFEFITQDAADSLDRDRLSQFFKSNVYKRFSSASVKKREMRFLTEMDAKKIKPELSDNITGEKILVQGAVDMMFEEDSKICIVDFKTDANKTEEQLIADHSEQLKMYGEALQTITGKEVKELIIYSFYLNKEIIV